MKQALFLLLFAGSLNALADDHQPPRKCLPERFVNSLVHQQICGIGAKPDCPPVCPGSEAEREKPYFERTR